MAKSSQLLLLPLLGLLLLSSVSARRAFSKQRFGQSPQCGSLDRISVSRSARQIDSEGGSTELWDEREPEWQCAGVAAMRNTIKQDSLFLPNYSPTPTLLYVESGQGLLGLSIPGCPDSFISSSETSEQEQEDRHQKIHRIVSGMLVSIPGGVLHWFYNDGSEDLVAFYVTDLKSETNQLDQIPRSFFLAGGEPGQESRRIREAGGIPSNSIFQGFDPELLAESLNVPRGVVDRMQKKDDRGLIVKVKERSMRVTKPDERESYYRYKRERTSTRTSGRGHAGNGVEETMCNMEIKYFISNPSEADVYSRGAGQLNSVNIFKLPILSYLQMSAEKGRLRPNAMMAPHWNMISHEIMYFTQGEGRMQIVSSEGRTVMDEEVREGDVVVVPQQYVSMKKAVDNRMAWVSFHTAGYSMRSMLVGQNSVLGGLPAQVISNSFDITDREAMSIKNNRKEHLAMFPPSSSNFD